MAQFECDVFVSYATVNNQPMAEGKPGWVTSFRDVLKKNLDEGLGRRNAGEVWMDDKLRGNEPFDEQLRGKVSSSATLLVILSNGYLQSKWCRRELDIFVEAAGGERGASGRIFLVHYEPLSPTLWPTALRGLSTEKYRFFKQERDGATPIPLGYPIPNPEESDHASFYNRLRDLVPDLTRRLNDVAPRGEALVAREDGAKLLIAPTVSAVFLDEVTGDKLFDQRQLLKSHLEQSDLRVLPTRFYGRSLTSEMDDELSGCTLYIQMLGRFGGGYEAIHHERAIAKGLPVLRWRSRDLLVASSACASPARRAP